MIFPEADVSAIPHLQKPTADGPGTEPEKEPIGEGDETMRTSVKKSAFC